MQKNASANETRGCCKESFVPILVDEVPLICDCFRAHDDASDYRAAMKGDRALVDVGAST